MTNQELYQAFREQDTYLKFGEFLEYCIEWEEESEATKDG